MEKPDSTEHAQTRRPDQNGRRLVLPPLPGRAHSKNEDEDKKNEAEPLSAEAVEFLNLLRKPAVVYDAEASYVLGFTIDAIGKLVAAKHLPALAHLSDGDQKRFSTAQLLQLSQNEEWMSKATDIIYGRRRKTSADKP